MVKILAFCCYQFLFGGLLRIYNPAWTFSLSVYTHCSQFLSKPLSFKDSAIFLNTCWFWRHPSGSPCTTSSDHTAISCSTYLVIWPIATTILTYEFLVMRNHETDSWGHLELSLSTCLHWKIIVVDEDKSRLTLRYKQGCNNVGLLLCYVINFIIWQGTQKAKENACTRWSPATQN